MTKKIMILALVLVVSNINFAQVGVSNRNPNNSAALDMSVNTGNKAFLPPRVTLTTLTNTTTPVSNPAEGLIVYNVGTAQLPGFYIFENGTWSLLATRENSIMNAIFENRTATTVNLSTVGTYATIGGLSVLSNNSGVDVTLNNTNSFTLQPGKYVINAILNITTAETPASAPLRNASTNRASHVHFYTGRIFDGVSAVGDPIQLNTISNSFGDKKHTVSFNFSFELSTAKTVSLQLARRAGGSFTNNITLNNTIIFIEKSLP